VSTTNVSAAVVRIAWPLQHGVSTCRRPCAERCPPLYGAPAAGRSARPAVLAPGAGVARDAFYAVALCPARWPAGLAALFMVSVAWHGRSASCTARPPARARSSTATVSLLPAVRLPTRVGGASSGPRGRPRDGHAAASRCFFFFGRSCSSLGACSPPSAGALNVVMQVKVVREHQGCSLFEVSALRHARLLDLPSTTYRGTRVACFTSNRVKPEPTGLQPAMMATSRHLPSPLMTPAGSRQPQGPGLRADPLGRPREAEAALVAPHVKSGDAILNNLAVR